MAKSLTYEKILELFDETDKRIDARLKKEAEEREKRWKEFEEKLEKDLGKIREEENERRKQDLETRKKEEEERRKQEEAIKRQEERKRKQEERKRKQEEEERRKEEEKSIKESKRRFEQQLGEITGTLGRFVEGMVEPKLLEMFRQRGIYVTEIYHNIEVHKKGVEETEIDLLLVNSDYSIAVEVKTTLKVQDVDEHLERLEKLTHYPIRPVKGSILMGAIAGMRIEENADKYAYRKGLFVLKQKGEIVEIANDAKFRPREWIVPQFPGKR